MGTGRQITEEDVLVTEALITESYSRLKTHVLEAPARALGPISRTISETISEHPLEAAATAVGGGIAAYGIARMVTSGDREKGDPKQSGKKHGKKKKAKGRHDPMMDILSALVPLAIPYLTGYLKNVMAPHPDSPKDDRPHQEN
ncbi:MAG: hypothetical protein WCH85_11505 [Methanomicrobiales archaeon]